MDSNFSHPYSGKGTICPECFEIHSLLDLTFKEGSEFVDKGMLQAICPNCNKKVKFSAIDDNLIFAVKMLNEKGYKTRYCCSGHMWHPSFYIAFEKGFAPPAPPQGLGLNKDRFDYISPMTCYRKEFKYKTDLDLAKKLLRFNLKFINWVLQLPERSE